MTIRDVFNSLPQRFRPEKSLDFKGVFHFDLTGKHAAQYTVSIEEGVCSVSSGLIGQPDCIIKTEVALHLDIEAGKTNPQWAYMTGKVKVSNIATMMQYMKLFKQYKPKETATIEAFEKPSQKSTQTQNRKKKNGPLQGIRILDLSRLLPGPMASMLLADWGADVIKIEDSFSPDDTRNYPPYIGNQSIYYLAVNRSKRSLKLNINSVEGKAVFFELLKTADIVLESFRPGVLKHFGIDYQAAKTINPRIIYVSVTGYGQNGEYAKKAGHDINYIGYSGILGLNSFKDKNPVIPGVQIADIAGGSYMAAIACLLGLQNRQITGMGDFIDVSMLDSCLPLMSLPLAEYFAGYPKEQTDTGILSGKIPNYNVYQCKDGKWLTLGALEPKFWAGFCKLINRPDWINAIIPDSQVAEQVKTTLTELFATKTRKEWIAEASEYDICLSPIQSIQEVVDDSNLQSRNMFRTHTHSDYGSITTINQPLKFSNIELSEGWAPPLLGEDTNAILSEIGYSLDQIEDLKTKGIL